LVVRTADPLRARRSLLDVGDPFLRFHYAIIRPNRAALARRRGADVWARSAATFRSQVLGPHFERLCREVVLDLGPDLELPEVADVGATSLYDPARRVHHEIDVVGTDQRGRVRLIGEAKASTAVRGLDDLARLERLRTLLPEARRAPDVHLVLFALGGADRALQRAASTRDDLTVVDAKALVGS
jgi:hypothetical protein